MDQSCSGPVTGMAREGKGFKLLHHFADLIKNNIVTFFLCRLGSTLFCTFIWTIFRYINGLIDRATADPARVLESIVAEEVMRSDVLLDLKIPPLPFKFASGPFRTFNKH